MYIDNTKNSQKEHKYYRISADYTTGPLTFHYIDSVSKSLCPSVVCCVCHCGKLSSRWTGDFWSKSMLLILAELQNI